MTVYQPDNEDRVTGAVAPFPPERPEQDPRPDTQKEQEARATAAALAGEHGTDGPPQQVDAPAPEGHHAGDFTVPGVNDGKTGSKAKDAPRAESGQAKNS